MKKATMAEQPISEAINNAIAIAEMKAMDEALKLGVEAASGTYDPVLEAAQPIDEMGAVTADLLEKVTLSGEMWPGKISAGTYYSTAPPQLDFTWAKKHWNTGPATAVKFSDIGTESLAAPAPPDPPADYYYAGEDTGLPAVSGQPVPKYPDAPSPKYYGETWEPPPSEMAAANKEAQANNEAWLTGFKAGQEKAAGDLLAMLNLVHRKEFNHELDGVDKAIMRIKSRFTDLEDRLSNLEDWRENQ